MRMNTDKHGFKTKDNKPCSSLGPGFWFLLDPRKSDFIRVQGLLVFAFFKGDRKGLPNQTMCPTF